MSAPRLEIESFPMRSWMMPLSAMLLVAAAGCGNGIGKTVPVAGVVTYDGKRLQTGTIIFRPDTARGNTGREAIGTIDDDGSFVLFTAMGPETQEGATPGWYKVGIVSTKEPDPKAKRIGNMPPPK